MDFGSYLYITDRFNYVMHFVCIISMQVIQINDNTHLEHNDNLVTCTLEETTFHFKLKTTDDAIQFITAANNITRLSVTASEVQEMKDERVTAEFSSNTKQTVQAREEKSMSNYGHHSELAFQGSSEVRTPSTISQSAVQNSGMVVTSHLQSAVALQTTSLPSGINNDISQANLSLDNESMNPVNDTSDNLPEGFSPDKKPLEVNEDDLDDVAQSDEQCREESQSQQPPASILPNHLLNHETSYSQASDEVCTQFDHNICLHLCTQVMFYSYMHVTLCFYYFPLHGTAQV